jgi:hypothetical protein
VAVAAIAARLCEEVAEYTHNKKLVADDRSVEQFVVCLRKGWGCDVVETCM